MDFEYEGYQYSMQGGEKIRLSELVEAIGILKSMNYKSMTEFLGDVETVEFSNSTLIEIEKINRRTSIKEYEGGAANSFIAERPLVAQESEDDDLLLFDRKAIGETLGLSEKSSLTVEAGDWILTSKKPFTSDELLTITLYDGTRVLINVTDAQTLNGINNTYNLTDVATVSLAYDSSVTENEHARNEQMTFSLSFNFNSADFADLKEHFKENPSETPTFVYDFSSLLKDGPFKSVDAKNYSLMLGKTKVGAIQVTADGVATITFDNAFFTSRTKLGASYDIDITLDETKNTSKDEDTFTFPGTSEVTVHYKSTITTEQKTLDAKQNDDGSYTLNYKAVIKNPGGFNSLEFKDTYSGLQSLVDGSIKVNGTTVTPKETNDHGFNLDINTIDKKTEYVVEYQTTVSKADYEANLKPGNSSWETNHADWVANGKNINGGDTSYEIKKEPIPGPVVKKESTANSNVGPDGTITYKLTIGDGNTDLAGVTITDNMTDVQYLTGTPTITGSGVTLDPDKVFEAYNNDFQYNTGTTQVINYTLPAGVGNGPIYIEYTTKIIDADTAKANGIYDIVTVSNTLTETNEWKSSTTTTDVAFEKQVQTKVNKSVRKQEQVTDGDKTYDVYTYTITIGDGTTLLDGVKARDVMSNNQVWIQDSFTMTGNNVPINDWAPNWTPGEGYQYTNWDQTVFDFTFPEGTGKGPVVITYKTRSLTDDEAKSSGIYGDTQINNRTTGGTGQDSTSETHHYPDEPKFPLEKSVAPNENVNPDDTVTYTVTVGSADTALSNLRVLDEMTDIQKLTSDITVTFKGEPGKIPPDGEYTLYDGTKITVSGGSFTMPKASSAWQDNGVSWNYFDDSSYSANENVRVFYFTFPDFRSTISGNEDNSKDYYGPVEITYKAKIINATEAGDNGITGTVSAKNNATVGNTTVTTEVKPEFPTNLNHDPTVDKNFVEWDVENRLSYWDIRIEKDAESSYPLTDVTLTEAWKESGVWYSTDTPLDSYGTNGVEDIDLLGAVIYTDGGVQLQAGADYTIDKTAGSFHFDTLNEAVTIRIAVKAPKGVDIIDSFKQHNKVKLTWHKDQWNTGELYAEDEAQYHNEKIDVTKNGQYDEDSRIISWTVVLNPYRKAASPTDKVYFTDTLPEGLELVDNTIHVQITGDTDKGAKVSWYSYDKDVLMTGNVIDKNADGTELNVDVSETYGNPCADGTSGLNHTSYTITYQTRVTDQLWNKITSSLSGSENLKNDAEFTVGGDTYKASDEVTVELKDYLVKKDLSTDEKYIKGGYLVMIDKYGHYLDDNGESVNDISKASNKGKQIYYGIEINPKEQVLNSGKTLTVTDRIDTNMDLDTESVVVYDADGHEITDLSAQGITVSYNDDTRYFTVSGLKDETKYTITYLATVRHTGEEVYRNTATLIGGGSHSSTTEETHTTQTGKATMWQAGELGLTLKKIDENNIARTLNGAEFEFYECQLATDVSDYTNEQWNQLLEDLDNNNEAVIEQVKKDFVITGSKKVGNTKATSTDGTLNIRSSEGLKEKTLYYWIETKAPTYNVNGKTVEYAADLTTKHYFVVYSREDKYAADDSKVLISSAKDLQNAAWALDDATQYANDITVASMSSETTWTVVNVEDKYTSITATKNWVGDYNNAYETRPKNGIQYNLYRIDADGRKTLMSDLSPVSINAYESNGRYYWPNYTWYQLPAKDAQGREYKYTVEELPVEGYITTYSDSGEGIGYGNITVTNTYIPKHTEINVKKVWEPENSKKPDQVKVTLYRILHYADGTTSKPQATSNTAVLTASNNWKYGWKNLATSDNDGNTITYTVVEDVAAMNGTEYRYAPLYSDNGEGVVSAPENNPIVITNVENAPGSLKITKNVTVNGKAIADDALDGVYTFSITNEDGTLATIIHDHEALCGSDNNSAVHQSYVVPNVEITIHNGAASSAIIDNLEAGTYRVTEITPSNGSTSVGGSSKTVKVVAGKTRSAEISSADFTNNIDRTRITATKTWANADRTTAWPTGWGVELTLHDDTTDSDVGSKNVSESSPIALWEDGLNGVTLNSEHNYSVKETAVYVGIDNRYEVHNGKVTIDGRTYKVSVSDEDPDTGVITVTNTELVNVPFTKTWGADGTDTWPADTSITVQLYRDGKAVSTEEMADAVKTLTSNPTGDLWIGLEAGHTYSVKETKITKTSTGDNVTNQYLSQQISATEIRNILNSTSLSVQKKWKNETGDELAAWPTEVDSVTATIVRRLAKKYVNGAWSDLNSH